VVGLFKKYSQIKLTMKREALQLISPRANEMIIGEAQTGLAYRGLSMVMTESEGMDFGARRNALE
jgi:predicted mannosyl-3-phosphoglycerate phosphatase (HAD superfamily)